MENLKVNNFVCKFDEDSLKKLKVETPGNNNYQVVYLNDEVKDVMKFKLKKDETAGILGNRVELYYNNYDKVYSEPYYLLKFMIDPSVNLDENIKGTIITQFHDIPGKGETWQTHKPSPPPLALTMNRNKFLFSTFNRIEWTIFRIAEYEIEVGKWYEILWHIKWSMGEDGFVEIFINGENITKEKYYTPTLFHFTGNTVKFGIYNNETENEIITYCSKLAIGNSLKEVESEYR